MTAMFTSFEYFQKHFRWALISSESFHKTGFFQQVVTVELFWWVQVSTLQLIILFIGFKSSPLSYNCMWRTTNAFITRNWPVPQFYGKWPFERFLGMQEPASVVFSILNFVSHCWMIRRFRQDVRRDSPMYYVWQIFCVVSKSLRGLSF